MSLGNGYDVRGEDEALRREIDRLDRHQTSTDQRLTQTVSATFTTIDRLAVGLGRIADLERAALRHTKLLEALCRAHGLEVPSE